MADVSARDFGNKLLRRLLDHTVEAVPGAVGAGLSLAAQVEGNDPDSKAPHSVAAVGAAAVLDKAQWSQGAGPIWEAFRTGEIVTRPQSPDADRPSGRIALPGVDGAAALPDEAALVRHLLGLDRAEIRLEGLEGPVRGAVFSTGEWGGDLPVVLSLYLERPPDQSALKELDRHEAALTSALALVEYCTGEELLAEQMVQMTQYRRVIEQAKGLVMGATSTNAESAFATLARASQHFNTPLRHLAVALVEHVGRAEAEHPDDPDLVVEPSRNDREVARRVWAALTASPILNDPA